MGITKFIQKVCVQTAVYWGNPQNDGYGKLTFDDPIELAPPTNGVRWEDKNQIIVDNNGKEVTSDAEILVNQVLDTNGYLYLGSLDDLTDEQKADPMLVDGARIIMSRSRIPMIKSTTEFVNMVYLRRKFYYT